MVSNYVTLAALCHEAKVVNNFKHLKFTEARRVVLGSPKNKFLLEQFASFIDCIDATASQTKDTLGRKKGKDKLRQGGAEGGGCGRIEIQDSACLLDE